MLTVRNQYQACSFQQSDCENQQKHKFKTVVNKDLIQTKIYFLQLYLYGTDGSASLL